MINCSSGLGAKRSQERMETYEKLYERRSCGMRNTTLWWIAINKDKCAEGHVCSREKENSSASDHLFRSDGPSKTLKKFWNFPVSSTTETSVCALYRLDAVHTLAVHRFLDITHYASVLDTTYQDDQNSNIMVTNAASRRKNSKKGRTIPHDSDPKLRCLLAVDTIILWNNCYDIFKSWVVASGAHLKRELSFQPVGLKIAWLRNGDKDPTIAFKMWSNGHYDITVIAHAIK